MKSFKTKYEWQFYPNAPKDEQIVRHKEQKKKHEREFAKLYRQACSYIAKKCHFKNKRGQPRTGAIQMGSHFSIWVADDREWCKKCESETGQDYAIFETVIEIQVLDYGEVKRRLALDSVMGIMGYGSYRDKDALEWLQKSQEEEK